MTTLDTAPLPARTRAAPQEPDRSMARRLSALLLLLAGCASHPPLPAAENVDLERFMGDWYVQAHIPARSERTAYNGVESYALGEDGRVLTTYAFRKGGFDGELEVMEPVGFVSADSDAVWGMRFVWPFRAEYVIAYLDEEHSETIVARTKRDYAWIMTREAEVGEERMAALTRRLADLGYDVEALRRVPQRWPDPEHPLSRSGGSMALYTRR